MVYVARRSGLTWPRSIFSGLGIVAIVVGCSKSSPSEPLSPLAIEAVGCRALVRAPETRPVTGTQGAICELVESRALRLVLPAEATDVRVRAEGAPKSSVESIDAGVIARHGGAVVSIEVPSGATRLVVDAALGGKRTRGTLAVAPFERIAWYEDARLFRANGDVDRAHALATAHANDAAPVERALAKGLLARIAVARGRADDAFPLFREAIDLHRASGRISDAADDSFALAFALHQRSQRYTEARTVLDSVRAEVALYPEGRVRETYYRGSLAVETGDHRRALVLLREAEGNARRLGMTRLERNARSALALEMQEMGRARASLPILAALEIELDEAARTGTEPPSACERVEVSNNRGWGALLVNESAAADGEPVLEDARGPLERALAIDDCKDAYVRASAQANLARLALARGDVASAERRLTEAKTGVKEPRGTERLAWLELEARIHLASGRKANALRVIDDALVLARASVLKLQEWSLLTLRGEVLDALGKPADAIEALRAAEDALDDATLLVPLGEGRGAFAGGRSRSARVLLGLLVKTRQLREASSVGQRAQGRVLSSVERALRLEHLAPAERTRWEEAVRAWRTARAVIDADAAGDWKLPVDALVRASTARTDRERELRSALEGALSLLARPADDRHARSTPESREPGVLEIDIYPDLRGFVVIANAADEARAHRVPPPRGTSSDDLARALFDPIEQSIARSKVIKIRAWGAWRGVDIHALPWRGAPLIEHVPVEYSIGLGAPMSSTTAGPALVVGDPTSDLPGALAEARGVATSLEAQHKPIRLLVRDDATSRAVTEQLRGAVQLHYAGHGAFAGEEGWESALPLAAGGRLTVGDILALAPAPRTVVLTGCEAAKSAGEAEGLGLAQAFIVAGSTEVLAPVRRVPDSLAGKLSGALYESLPATADMLGRLRLASPMRRAVLALRKEDPESDWAAFRVLVP